MNRFITGGLLLITLAACKSESDNGKRLKTGIWRALVEIQDQELPFNFEVTSDDQGGYDIYLLNADDRLLLDEVTIAKDSVDIALHIFDANIKAKISGDTLRGVFIKNFAEDYRLPFEAVHGVQYRFEENDTIKNTANFSGKFDVTFLHEGDTTKAIALFRQRGENRVMGTFMTPTGDYRFLEGNAQGPKLQLSAFDGNYAYLFKGVHGEDGKIRGEFFSGKTWYETWVAEENEKAVLPDAESLTYLKGGYKDISFSFPDVNGKIVSLNNEKYKGKVIILQLLGTWCPNCMDETKFLSPWYNENKQRGVEVIGLAYERKDDFNYASARVKKMVDKMDIQYDILIAGTDDKEKAGKTLPMLNALVAFPTTIFIGKDGKVKKIHTGFNGPGTRQYYEQFIEDFNETVNELLKEDFTAVR
ncbi:MAG: TlpA disulfide reductase family protein [Cyclobacteriaceae bacterium]